MPRPPTTDPSSSSAFSSSSSAPNQAGDVGPAVAEGTDVSAAEPAASRTLFQSYFVEKRYHEPQPLTMSLLRPFAQDLLQLLFERCQGPMSFASFKAIWKSSNMYLVHQSCPEDVDYNEFMDACFRDTIMCFSLFDSFAGRLCLLYVLYVLFATQKPGLRTPIRVDMRTWRVIEWIHASASEAHTADAAAVISHLMQENAFLFTAFVEHKELPVLAAEVLELYVQQRFHLQLDCQIRFLLAVLTPLFLLP